MQKNPRLVVGLAALAAFAWYATREQDSAPLPAPKPGPAPSPAPAPPKKPKPWGPKGCDSVESIEKISITGPIAPDGKTEVQTDLAVDQRKHNISSKGLGCCVFRSLDHAGHYQQVVQLYGFPEWMVQHGVSGGGYPGKVDQLIPLISSDRGLPTPDYLQYEGRDPSILIAALASGRMPCVTYNGHDPHYGMGQSIAHMVNLVYLDDQQACILDNNYVGENDLVWMTAAEFKQRWTGGGGGWCVVLLNAPPPPVPHN